MSTNSIWSYQENFDFRRDVGPDSPFHYPLENHRGEYSRQKMLTAFHLDGQGHLRPGVKAKVSEAVLFGGHIGCGKSTELRDYAQLLKNSYTVHHLELTKTLDINSLRFSDLLVALVHALVRTFQNSQLSVHPDPTFVDPVIQWFDTRILKQERFRDIEGEIKTEVKATGGIPFLASLLGTITAKVRGGASYREELRRELRDGFFQLLQSFNALIAHTNDVLKKQSQGPLLFIIDGTDKLSKEDSETFFTSDVNQLGQIQTNLIVCAPISVLLEAGVTGHRFTRVQLPMVKVFDADEMPREQEEDALIDLLLKRMPLSCFDDRETVRFLVRHSGGHVRDLIRLVRAAFSRITGNTLSLEIAKLAVRDVASEYQRLIRKSDWADLVHIDRSLGSEKDRTDDRLRLLYDLVLLEYNNYWWRSHPLVRTLAEYAQKKSEADQSAKPG
jgi:energy-coupling factor transporter ATP-binding protein EcfA2